MFDEDCALREVGEVGGTEAEHQKHLRLHLRKVSISSRTSGKTNNFLLLLIMNFTCSVFIQQLTIWQWELLFCGECLERNYRHTNTWAHADFFSQAFLLKSCMAGYEAAYYSSVTFIILRHWRVELNIIRSTSSKQNFCVTVEV